MLRQLDQRNTAGITVTLEWDSETDQVLVRCEDEDTDGQPLLCYPVDPHDARFAFLHPFAASPLHEPRSLDVGPGRYANDDRPPPRSVANDARTPYSAQAADLDVDVETENNNSPRRRWYHLRPNPRQHGDLTELEYYTWWPL
jgi:hypothetical protein